MEFNTDTQQQSRLQEELSKTLKPDLTKSQYRDAIVDYVDKFNKAVRELDQSDKHNLTLYFKQQLTAALRGAIEAQVNVMSDTDTLSNYIYDIDEQGDALRNEMCDHGSYDNVILNERIRTPLPNGVSGVVASPTPIDDIDTAGCNADALTVSDADNAGAACNAEKLAMSDAPINIVTNNIHTHIDEHRKCETYNVIHNNNNVNDKSYKRKLWSKAIAMYGTINEIPALILFDPGAEGNFISESLIRKHNITTEQTDDSRIGLSYDGGARSIDRIVLNVNGRVQNYNDSIELHASPLAQYDVILGVPWHEMVDAHTHHRQRMITLSLTDSNGNVNEITLKQQKRDARIQRNIHNDIT